MGERPQKPNNRPRQGGGLSFFFRVAQRGPWASLAITGKCAALVALALHALGATSCGDCGRHRLGFFAEARALGRFLELRRSFHFPETDLTALLHLFSLGGRAPSLIGRYCRGREPARGSQLLQLGSRQKNGAGPIGSPQQN